MCTLTNIKFAIILSLLVFPLTAQVPTPDTAEQNLTFSDENLAADGLNLLFDEEAFLLEEPNPTTTDENSHFNEQALADYMALVNPFDRKAPLYAQVEALITKKNGRQKNLNYEMFAMRDSEIVSVMIHLREPGGYSNTRMLITVPVEGGFPNVAVMMSFFALPFRITELSNPLSFFGMDITSEDMNPRNTATDTYRILETVYADNINQNAAITSNPIDKNVSEIIEIIVEGVPNVRSDYARMVYYIDTKTTLTMKTEFYDDKNRKIKVLEVLETASPNGIMSATVLKMSDLKSESNTILTYKELEYNTDVSRFISENYLKTGNIE